MSNENSCFLDKSQVKNIFLHYFDIHFLKEKEDIASSLNFINEMKIATRIAISIAETVYVPASSYFESELCRNVVGEFNELLAYGIITLTGSSPNLAYFVQDHKESSFYREYSHQYISYNSLDLKNGKNTIPYSPRQRSATKDIASYWKQSLETERLQRMLRDASSASISKLENRLEYVPMELGGLAFIPEHTFEILDLEKTENLIHSRIRSLINEAYFGSYTEELNAGVISELKYLSSPFKIPSFGKNISYAKILRHLYAERMIEKFITYAPYELLSLRKLPEWQTIFLYATEESESIYNTSQITKTMHTAENNSNNMAIICPDKALVTVFCLSAAEIETKEIRKYVNEKIGKGEIIYFDDDKKFFATKHIDSESNIEWFVIGQNFQGETETASILGRIMNHKNPDLIIMAGMCMGVPNKKLPIGTVIIPNEVFFFDHSRITEEGESKRPHGERVDGGLYSLAKIVASNESLNFSVKSDKALASASAKIENQEAALIKKIESEFPDVVAYDMESWGFYQAAKDKHCLWIKAIADSGETQSTSPDNQNQKKVTQAEVTNNAIAFAVLVAQHFANAKKA